MDNHSLPISFIEFLINNPGNANQDHRYQFSSIELAKKLGLIIPRAEADRSIAWWEYKLLQLLWKLVLSCKGKHSYYLQLTDIPLIDINRGQLQQVCIGRVNHLWECSLQQEMWKPKLQDPGGQINKHCISHNEMLYSSEDEWITVAHSS